MLLLPKKKIEEARNDQAAFLARERGVLKEAVDGLHGELNALHGAHRVEMEALEAEGRKQVEVWQEKIQLLKDEVASLEERRRQAKMPLDEYRGKLEAVAKSLDERTFSLDEREAKFQDLRSELVEKISEAADTLTEARQRAQEASRRVLAVEKAESANKLATDALNAKWDEFNRTQIAAQEKLHVKENELVTERALIEADKRWVETMRASFAKERLDIDAEKAGLLKMSEELIAADKAWLEDMRQTLAKDRLKLESERAALIAARDEINSKRI